MKKLILTASALALAGAASAEAPADPGVNATDSTTIAQPAPRPSSPEVNSQRVGNFFVEMRPTYPICTMEIRDNCVQRMDPGGSNLALANQGTLGVNGTVFGVGGPEVD